MCPGLTRLAEKNSNHGNGVRDVKLLLYANDWMYTHRMAEYSLTHFKSASREVLCHS